MLLLTCPHWLSWVLNNELKKLGYSPENTFETGTFVDVWLQDAYAINLRSRIANKVFLRLSNPKICTDFDDLFALVWKIDRSKYVWKDQWVSVKVHIRQSNIDSSKSAQAIVQKSILTQLAWWKDKTRHVDEWWQIQQVYIIINKNMCTIYINTSGKSLHERWYREAAWAAPLKENIAAAMVQLAWWSFKQALLDPCCGSWTICIEAAMIARNIAPGLQRYFAFEHFPCHEKEVFETIRDEAKKKKYDGSYTIIWSDIDEEVLKIAKENADHMWVWDTIQFKQWDIFENTQWDLPLSTQDLTVITNPPYGKRLSWEDLQQVEDMHELLATSLTKKTVLITWAEHVSWFFHRKQWSAKQTKNGASEVSIYLSK